MQISHKTAGIALALAAATLFSGCASSDEGEMAKTSSAKVQCMRGNSCKGTSECKTATNGCKGQNSCKGQGWITATEADCDKAGGEAMPM